MGQCVLKDCGFNYEKLNSPQKKNLHYFLKERINEKYRNSTNEDQINDNTERFLSEEEVSKLSKNFDNKLSLRQQPNLKIFSLKELDSRTFNFIDSDKNIGSISTKELLAGSKEKYPMKISSMNDNIETLKDIPEIIKPEQKQHSSNQIQQSFEKSKPLIEYQEEDENSLYAYKGFENRLFIDDNLDDNFENILSDDKSIQSYGSFDEKNFNEKFEKCFPESLIEKTSRKEKKIQKKFE